MTTTIVQEITALPITTEVEIRISVDIDLIAWFGNFPDKQRVDYIKTCAEGDLAGYEEWEQPIEYFGLCASENVYADASVGYSCTDDVEVERSRYRGTDLPWQMGQAHFEALVDAVPWLQDHYRKPEPVDLLRVPTENDVPLFSIGDES